MTEVGLVPPHDRDAEQAVLGGVLLSGDALTEVAGVIHEGDFYRPAHETVWQAVLAVYGRGDPADPITVAAELSAAGDLGRVGGAPYLHTLVESCPSVANVTHYARIVADKAVQRRLLTAGMRITQLAYREGDTGETIAEAQQELLAATERHNEGDATPIGSILPDALDELDAIGSGQVGGGVPTGLKDLDDLLHGLHAGQLVMVAARPALGKALALDTPLPTPDGWTTMGEVQPGDYLIGADGNPVRVTTATSVLRDRTCYRVQFSDGTSVVADADHQWSTVTRAARRRGDGPAVVTTETIAQSVRVGSDRRANHMVRNTAPFVLPPADLPIPPYTLGAWLSDGHSAGSRITTGDPEVATEIEREGIVVKRLSRYVYGLRTAKPVLADRVCQGCGGRFIPANHSLVRCGRRCNDGRRSDVPGCLHCGAPTWSRTGLCQRCGNADTFTGRLRALGVLGDKHIPDVYLRSSEEQRRALFAGLLDSDGTISKEGYVSFDSTRRRLAYDVLHLARTLGYAPRIRAKRVRGRTEESSVCYTVGFTTLDKVFRLPRKAARLNTSELGERNHSRYVTAVEPVESVPVRCVQVANGDRLYLAGEGMVPTHNSTLALDVARHAAIRHGQPVVMFSLEMSRNEIAMRLLSAEAKVQLHKMRGGTLSTDDWDRIARRTTDIGESPLFVDDSPMITVDVMRSRCRRIPGLRLVILDYLQLAASDRKAESRQLEVSALSRGLKLLAKQLDVPVVAVSQLNRGAEQRADKKPLLSDLRESGSLEQDSDVVILLHREDAYDDESPRAGEADLIVAKHRNGPTATVTVAFQGHYSRFVDMA